MSDPLSAAASAVGVISLGLQVCQHLVTYCQAYKSYDQDIERIRITAQGLKQPLKDLRDLIEESEVVNTEITADLGEKALGLGRMIDSLKKTLVRFHVEMPVSGLTGKVKGHLSKAVYPFRRATLKDMLEDLNKIQAVLQTTLSICSTRIIRKVEIVQETLLEERLDMQAIPNKQIPAPALVRSWCDCHIACAELIKGTQPKLSTRLMGPGASDTAGCDVEIYCAQVYTRKARQRKNAMIRTYKYTCAPLRLAITAFFSMSTGAGAFSIAPALTLQAILKWKGSVAELMWLSIHHKETPNGAGKVVSNLIGRLQPVFSKGEAAPSALYLDTFGKYRTLLNMQAVCMEGGNRQLLPSIWTLTRFLVDHGALPDNTDPLGLLGCLITHVVFNEEVQRLYMIARSCLREDEIQAFGLNDGTHPDTHASEICKAIAAHKKVIDPSLLVEPREYPLYQENWQSVKAMQALYNAGFRELDQPNSNGVTPLMMASTDRIFNFYVGNNGKSIKVVKVHGMIGRTPKALAEIAEENKQGVEVLENFILEFDAKYHELGLSIWEFLEGYWHTRMVEYLCERDPYDEEHDREARSMGVFLQPEENDPLDRVSLLIGGRVKEVSFEDVFEDEN
ncbi:uncharacterized protein BDV14DRAFT_201306 [Aspergillus stella-maris]|uniref:uncharacterized protein n=1 Tax=Aspergillus stella-maris TaxID=1810926 RepID=UPI003CCD5EA4